MDVAADFAVAAFTSAVDGLLSLALTSLPGLALIELSGRVEFQLRRLACFDQAVVTALVDCDAYAEVGARNTVALLVQALRISPTEAGARVRAAKDLGPRTDFTGGPMKPSFELVAAAQADGSISSAHARVITATVASLPIAARGEHGEPLERFLVGQACAHAPDFLARAAKHAVTVLDPDGTLSSDEDHHRRRSFTLTPRADGSSDVRGYLTPQCTAVVLAVLDPLASPASATKADSSVEAVQDPRSYPQRMHDALQDAGQRILASGSLPDNGGVPSVLVITMTETQFATGIGTATTGHGQPINVTDGLHLVDQAEVIPVVLDTTGGIVRYGRMRRNATPAQRRALAARDGGCSFPGCDAPPSWTEAHHVQRWKHGGLTNLENLTLVCGYHHREHERQGWDCDLTSGVPLWLPPYWIDEQRTPLRNTTHHIERFLVPTAA